MALNNILKNFNLFVDGRGYAGNCEEVTPPKLTLKTEEFRNGGMDAPVEIDMGMDKLEASFSLTSYDPGVLALWGLAPGNTKQLTLRGSVQSDDGTENPVVIQMQGMLKEIDQGSWKPGDRTTLKAGVACSYYKHTVNGVAIHEIDVKNMVRKINGVDQLARTRANIGM